MTTMPIAYKLDSKSIEIAKAISKEMPHLVFSIWDLNDFLPAFHNVRKNMFFIECENLARPKIMTILASKLRHNFVIYSGERKPKAVSEELLGYGHGSGSGRGFEDRAGYGSILGDANVIVVLSRNSKDLTRESVLFKGSLENVRIPFLERRLVDLISYSLKGWLPIPLEEAIAAFKWHFKKNHLRLELLHRYATRKYLGWFLEILLYKLEKSGELDKTNLDPRYLRAGGLYLGAIEAVNKK
ncbi:MAG: hypothetical protein HY392_04560 [Candidatus Diapherotrites archaeon]|nr:hypothetical protein [Candidatus Diapherotrites archaeon]